MIQNLSDLLLWLNQPQTPADGRCGNTYSLRMLHSFSDEAYRSLHCYRQAEIPKKNGGFRRLCIPRDDLKALQRRLLPLFFSAQDNLPASVFAYRRRKTLRQHAACHTGCSLLVKLDICDFFDSISFGAVFRAVDDALRLSPLVAAAPSAQATDSSGCRWYNRQLSWHIAQFCTQQGSLPQGAPTSPALSNLVFAPLDLRIEEYCKARTITFTRYADDMIFSFGSTPAACPAGDTIDDSTLTDSAEYGSANNTAESDEAPGYSVAALIAFVRSLLLRNGFRLNGEKTVIAGPGRRHMVTGAVVHKAPQAPASYRKTLRQEIYYIGKYGLREHLLRTGVLTPATGLSSASAPSAPSDGERAAMIRAAQSLLGRVSFVLQLNPDDREFQQYRRDCLHLLRIVYHI